MRELFLSAVALLALTAVTVSLDAPDPCPLGKYLPHECKCSLYYECDEGLIIERVCPTGQGFDENLKRCVAAKDAACHQPQEEVYCPLRGNKIIADKRNCSVYHECVDGVRTSKVCNDGLSFNEELGICTWPPSIDCQLEKELVAPPSYSENKKGLKCPPKGYARLPHECLSAFYYECNNGKMTGKQCPKGSEYDRVNEACYDPNAGVFYDQRSPSTRYTCPTQCSPDGNELIRHETDCSYYYRCESGRKVLSKCFEGYKFNCFLQVCDLPHNTDCNAYEYPAATIDERAACTKCNCGIVRTPHSNCSLYYQCENGVNHVHECPKGFYYNRKTQICTYLEEADCRKPTDCVEGEVMPHQCQCDRYYVCENGEKVIVTCPVGKHFDADRKVCDDPDKAHCKPTTNHCIGNCTSSARIPHEDCRKYCACDHGVSTTVDCPDHQIYDTETNKCQFPENVKSPRCDPFPCEADGLLPHECYCDRYFQCKNGTKTLQWCEDGKHFDYEKGTCVLCRDAHCFASAKVPTRLPGCKQDCSSDNPVKTVEHENCGKYCACNDCTGQVIKDCPRYRFYDPKTGQCERPENIVDLPCNPFPCTLGVDGYLPHECDCTLYYQCENGKMHERHCPEGTHYDYDTSECVQSGGHCYSKNTTSIYDSNGRKVGCGSD